MPIFSPGAEAADALGQAMMQQATMRHNALMDELAKAKEGREQQNQQWEHEDRVQASKDRLTAQQDAIEQRKSAAQEKEANDFLKQVDGTMRKGDIPDAEMVKKADRLGVGYIFPTKATPNGEQGPAQPGQPPMGQASTRIYGGSKTDRDEEAANAKMDAFQAMLDDPVQGPYLKSNPVAMEAAWAKAGFKTALPAALLNNNGEGGRTIVFNPRSGQYHLNSPDGPIVTNHQPNDVIRDLSVPDPNAGAARADRETDVAIRWGLGRTAPDRKVASEAVSKASEAMGLLAQGNRKSDALLGMALLQAVNGAMGAFRLTNTELGTVQNTRGLMDRIKGAVGGYTDIPENSPVFQPEERKVIYNILQGVYKRSATRLGNLIEGEAAISGARSAREVTDALTKTHKDLYESDQADFNTMSEKATPVDTKSLAEQAIQRKLQQQGKK